MPDQINKISVEGTVYQVTPSETGTFNGTSEDGVNPSSWTTVSTLTSGETNGSIFTKISQMFKNIRFLYGKLGSVDISTTGSSVTDAIANLETNKADVGHTHSVATTAAAGFMPVLEDDTTKYLRSDGTWVKPAGAEYSVFTTAADGLAPMSDGDNTHFLRADGTWVKPAGEEYSDATTAVHGLMSTSDKVKLDSVETSANNYVHPTYTSAASGLYKVAVDDTGHISGATAVAKADITALGIPASDTNTTYAAFTSAAAGLVPAAASGSTNYATTGYVLTGAGWAAGTKYNTDTNTTYAAFTGSTTAAAGTNGLVPAPTTAQVGNYYLKHNKTWAIPPNTTYANFKVSTTADNGTAGLVPAPSSSWASRNNYIFLRASGGWSYLPAPTTAEYGGVKINGSTSNYLRGDGTWQTPPNTNTTYAFSNGNPTLAWGTKSTVGTAGGVAFTVTMPANPNTNTTYGTNVGCYGTLSGTTLTLNTRNFRV